MKDFLEKERIVAKKTAKKVGLATAAAATAIAANFGVSPPLVHAETQTPTVTSTASPTVTSSPTPDAELERARAAAGTAVANLNRAQAAENTRVARATNIALANATTIAAVERTNALLGTRTETPTPTVTSTPTVTDTPTPTPTPDKTIIAINKAIDDEISKNRTATANPPKLTERPVIFPPTVTPGPVETPHPSPRPLAPTPPSEPPGPGFGEIVSNTAKDIGDKFTDLVSEGGEDGERRLRPVVAFSLASFALVLEAFLIRLWLRLIGERGRRNVRRIVEAPFKSIWGDLKLAGRSMGEGINQLKQLWRNRSFLRRRGRRF